MARNFICAVDVGSSRIKAAAGEVLPGERINVLGISSAPSTGIRRGTVIDAPATAEAIDSVLNELEHLTGVPINETRVCFSAPSLFSFVNRAAVAVSNPSGEITSPDLERLLKSARMVNIPPTHSMVHLVPRHYTIDGMEGVREPSGMIGHRLEAEVLIIAVATSFLQNLVNTLGRAGVKVRDLAISSFLSAEAVLAASEKDMGVVLIDIGGGTTDLAVYTRGAPLLSAVLPLGGEHITNDLAIGLRTMASEARSLKENYGCCSTVLADEEVLFNVTSIYGKESRVISEKTLASIIEPRVQELMQFIADELDKAGLTGRLPGGAVFTGGSAKLKGILQVGEEYLMMNTRIGYPENIWGDFDHLKNPEYSSLIGALLFGNQAREMVAHDNREVTHFSKYLEKVVDKFMYFLK
ncbi:MAG: cell division protein FtsA [Methylocystaceae bacterium]